MSTETPKPILPDCTKNKNPVEDNLLIRKREESLAGAPTTANDQCFQFGTDDVAVIPGKDNSPHLSEFSWKSAEVGSISQETKAKLSAPYSSNRQLLSLNDLHSDKCYQNYDEASSMFHGAYRLFEESNMRKDTSEGTIFSLEENPVNGLKTKQTIFENVESETILRQNKGTLTKYPESGKSLGMLPLRTPFQNHVASNMIKDYELRTGNGKVSAKKPLVVKMNQQKAIEIVDETVSRYITPLLSEVESEVQSVEHLVPEAVSDDWIRGGYPSRDLKYRSVRYPTFYSQTIPKLQHL